MYDGMKTMLIVESTRWAELLLSFIKIALGISLLLYLVDPPRSNASLSPALAASFGAGIVSIGLVQLAGVLAFSTSLRVLSTVLATGMWVLFLGSTYLATNSLRSILVFIPLVAFNMWVFLRLTGVLGWPKREK